MNDEAALAAKNDNATLQMLQNRAAQGANTVEGDINKVGAELSAITRVVDKSQSDIDGLSKDITTVENMNRAMQKQKNAQVQSTMAATMNSVSSLLETNALQGALERPRL